MQAGHRHIVFQDQEASGTSCTPRSVKKALGVPDPAEELAFPVTWPHPSTVAMEQTLKQLDVFFCEIS